MFEDRLVLRIGALVSLLLVAAVVFALQIDFRDLGPTTRVQLFLRHPGALVPSADVQLGGRKIGVVHSIRLVTSNEARRADHPLHPEGGVLCEVWVRKKYLPWVRLNSEIFVNAKGIIGESYLEVAPPPGDQEMLRPIQGGDRLRGIDPARMEHVIVTSFNNAKRFGELLAELEPSMKLFREQVGLLRATVASLEPGPNTFADIGDSVGRASDEFAKLTAGFDAGSLDRVQVHGKRLLQQARRDLAAIDSSLNSLSLQLQVVEERLPDDLTAKYRVVASDAKEHIAVLRTTIATLQDIAAKVESGSGTVGALINDPEFSDDAKQLGRYLKRHPWKFLTRPVD